MLKKISTLVIVLSIFIIAAGCIYIAIKEGFPNYHFKAGQVWKYKNRPGEDDSIIRILKVERYDKYGKLIHISVENIKLTNADHRDTSFYAITIWFLTKSRLKIV